MAFQYHRYLLQTCITCTLTNSVDSHLHLSGSVQHAFERICCSHTKVVMTVGRDNGPVYIVDMLHQVAYLAAKLFRQAVTCGIGDVDNGGTSLDNGFDNTCQILIIRTTSIFCIELHIINILLRILYSCHSTLNDFLTSTVEFILDMLVASTDTRMDTLVLGILQCLGCHIDIARHGTRQRTYRWPCHSLRYFNHRMVVTRTGNRESSLNHVNAQLLQCLCHLNLLHSVQLTSGHLFAIAKCCVENK